MPSLVKSVFAEVNIFIFGPKTMDYSPWFDFCGSLRKVLRKVYHLKGNRKINLMALVSVA